MLATRVHPPILAALALFAATPATQTFSPFETKSAAEPSVHATYVGTFSPFETFADAKPWPHGMVIAPPRTADTMAIVPDRSHDSGDWPHGMVIRPPGDDGGLLGLLAPLLAPVSALLM